MARLRVIALGALLVSAGCAGLGAKSVGAASGPGSEVAKRFSASLDGGEFHEAFLLVDEVTAERREIAEDSAEYWRVVDMTAAKGEREWAGILKDERIPLHRKVDLVKVIDYVHCRARE